MSVLKPSAVVLLALAAPAAADPPLDSATSSHLGKKDLERRPHARPIDLVRHLPGLYAILVDGGGEAPELLVRGFDARQGQDLAVMVDDVPVNAAGHAGGHGYADLGFLIPIAVSSVDLHEGPYAARWGDFATAGVLDIHTLDQAPHDGAMVRMLSGSEITGPVHERRLRRLFYDLSGIASPKLAHGSALLAGEVGIADGPYVNPQRMRRGALMGSWSDGGLRAAITFYSGRWADSGVLPDDEIYAGRLGPYSAADPTQGGDATRASASLGITRRDLRGDLWHLAGYVVRSNHRFYTNPTLFADDTDAGDQVEQVDARTAYGLDGWWQRGALRAGVQAHADDAASSLWHDQRRRRLPDCFTVMNPCTDTDAHVRDVAAYLEDRFTLGARVAISPGLRLDELIWDSTDLDPETATGRDSLTATAARARLSPKLGVDLAASDDVDVLVRAGGGFRSSDTHSTVESGAVRAIPRIWSGEIGVQVHPGPLRAAVASYLAWQDREVGWLPERGETLLVPATTRYGIEATVRFDPTDWLSFDAGAALSRATTFVPGMPLVLGGAGVSVTRGATSVSLRGVGVGARAFTPALWAPGAFVCSLVGTRTWRRFQFELDVENLLDASWREEQSFGEVRPSRLVPSYPDVRFSPGAPMTALASVTYVMR